MSDLYLIWSNEHRAWWRPRGRGYTMQLEKAGRYSREDAIKHCRVRDQEPGVPLPELPIREDDVLRVIWVPKIGSEESRGPLGLD